MILVDVGNSSIKWCQSRAGSNGALGVVSRCSRSPEQLVAALANADMLGATAWISSVGGVEFDNALAAALTLAGFQPRLVVTPAEQGGVTNSYAEPHRMGVDRWLAMLAAKHDRAEPVAVVDAGTALTIDLVSATGQHEGGYIIPGVGLMERSLLRDTQRVRFDEDAPATLAPGTSTAGCVRSGLWVAAFGSVQLVLQRHPHHRVVVTGGDGQALMSLGINGEWRPHLVLEGLALTAAQAPH